MMETKEKYATFRDLTGTYSEPGVTYAPPPDNLLTVLETIRDLADHELARIERHGGCVVFALRIKQEVQKVLR